MVACGKEMNPLFSSGMNGLLRDFACNKGVKTLGCSKINVTLASTGADADFADKVRSVFCAN